MKLYAFFILAVLSNLSDTLQAQVQKISWQDIAKVEYLNDLTEDKLYGTPIFSEEVLHLEGKTLEITGFLLPLDTKGDKFMLSKFPFSTCFFCSSGPNAPGPETVIELQLQKKYEWMQLDDILTFKGKFILNDIDPNKMMFILQDASVSY